MRREALRRQNDKPYAKMLAYKKETAKYLSAASKDAQNGDFGRFFTDSRHALQFALAARQRPRSRLAHVARGAGNYVG